MSSGAYILNDNLEPVDGSGTVGQLFVSSPNLAMGYCGVKAEGKSFIRAEVNNNILTVHPRYSKKYANKCVLDKYYGVIVF